MSSSSFFHLIEKLQQKPDKEKDKIIFILTGIVMIFIIGIWLSLPGEEVLNEQTIEQQAGPLRVLWQEIKENVPTFTP